MAATESLRYDGKVALVTGAGRGMGRTHALLLAERGAKVVVNDLGVDTSGQEPSSEAAEAVVAEIRAGGGETVPDAGSVAEPQGAERMVSRAIEEFGRLDIVVNNAGLSERFGVLWPEEELDDLDRQLTVHTRGCFLVSKAAWPQLAANQGRLVNIASNRGLFGGPTGQSYNMAKGGVVGLTRGLAIAGAEQGVRVNAVLPLAMTRMVGSGSKTSLGIKMSEIQPAPEYVSQIVGYLAHERCQVNGEIYTAGMGRYARVFIGVTQGIFDADATVDTIDQRIDDIRAEEAYTVPFSGGEEMAIFFEQYEANMGSVGT